MEKGKGWSREEGKVTQGMGGTGQAMGWNGEGKAKGKEEGEGKGGEGLQLTSIPGAATADLDPIS